MALTILHFSASGGGKTTQLGLYAQYEYERTGGKKVRLATAEEWFPIQPLVDLGVVEVFPLTQVPLKNRFYAMRKLSQGWWPKDKGSLILVAPTAETWKTVGAYGVEGLTSISDVLMDEARRCDYSVGEAPAGGSFTQGEGASVEKFQNQSRSQYTLVQREWITLVRSFAALPVDRVMFTAHESKGEEEDTRAAIMGPGLAGKAATDKVPGWVGDCLHSDVYSEQFQYTDPVTKKVIATIRPQIRTFFLAHPEQRTQVMFKCKPRVPASRIPELLKRWPGGFLTPTVQPDGKMVDGIDQFLRFEDELIGKAGKDLTEWKMAVDTMAGLAKAS